MKKTTLSLLAIAIAASALADDFDDMFSDDAFSDVVVVETDSPGPLTFAHEIGLSSTLNYNSNKDDANAELYSDITALELNYRPSFSYQPNDAFSVSGEFLLAADTVFWIREGDGWSSEDIDARQTQFEIRELLAQYRLANWQLSSGVQNVTLGLADALSVANVLYAQNIATPGAGNLDDILMPAWTSLISGSVGRVRLKIGSVHTHEVNAMPVTGTDFDSGMNTMLAGMGLSIEQHALALENMAWFASVSGAFGAFDWQANAVSQLSHSPVIQVGPTPAIIYPRSTNMSVALSAVSGSFLWKFEAALNDALQAQNSGMSMVEYQKAASTIGFDFDHSSMGRLIAEIQYNQILDFSSLNLPNNAMTPSEQTVQWALMYTQSFLREQLSLTGQLIGFDLDSSGGRMQALGLEYDVTDQLTAGLRLVDYVDGSYQFMQGAGDRDRLIASVVYRF